MLLTPPPSPPLGQCAPEDRLGFRLGGYLELTRVLGVGAYGVVYTARDVYTGQDYAVKALSKLGLDARQRRFQQREIQLHHEASSHPNVVSLIKVMDTKECTYVVMEFCPEGDLFSSITEQLFYVGDDRLIRSAFLQILDAVAFCHLNGIYHRDLKPENILITDGGHTIKLADFGLATREPVTSDFGCGSTFYMSPECQASPQGCYASAPNDVWSLGVILVNLACGRNPWKRASIEDATFRAFLKDPHFLSSILPISGELEAILRRIFECNPEQRISMGELRLLILNCRSFAAAPKPAPAPTCSIPAYESPVVVFDHHGEAAAFASPPTTPPRTPPGISPYARPTIETYPQSPESALESDSEYESDEESVYSSASSVSSYGDASLCPPTPQYAMGMAPQNFYYFPPIAESWKKAPSYHPHPSSVPCY